MRGSSEPEFAGVLRHESLHERRVAHRQACTWLEFSGSTTAGGRRGGGAEKSGGFPRCEVQVGEGRFVARWMLGLADWSTGRRRFARRSSKVAYLRRPDAPHRLELSATPAHGVATSPSASTRPFVSTEAALGKVRDLE